MLMPSDKLTGLLLEKDHENAETQPEAPAAPPPLQPVTAQHNPYEFITNPSHPPKKKLLPGGNSKIGRLIIAGVGVVVLLMIALIVMSLINSGSTALKTDYQNLVSQQAEVIRISGIGATKARQSEAKNLAITTQYSLTTQQSALLALAKKAGANTDAKSLAASKDSKTDAALTSADQANQFDEVFTKTLTVELQKYQLALKKVYDATTSASTKDTLSKDYNAVDALLGKKVE